MTRLPIAFTLCTGLLLSVLLAGCNDKPQASSLLGQALQDYEAERYTLAHQRAVEVMNGAPTREREQATYLAGLSAYHYGDIDEAERHFATVIDSVDLRLAGGAQAMLGQIRLDQHRAGDAARLFESAYRKLNGEDGRQAARYAAIAHQQAGNSLAAQRWSDIGHGYASLESPRGFALQVGAFREHRRAVSAARNAETISTINGHGPVHVVPTKDQRGRELYLVQFGRFETRNAASEARTRLGHLEFIVTPLASAMSQ